MNKRWWLLHVSSYGNWAVYGTKAQAEEILANKMDWEGEHGTMKAIKPDDPEVAMAIKIDYQGKDPNKRQRRIK